jgi:hypothetical protein
MLRGAIERERDFIFECVGTALGEEIGKQHKADRAEFAQQHQADREEVTKLWSTVKELTKVVTALNRKSEREEIEKRHQADIARIWDSVKELSQAIKALADRAQRGEPAVDVNKLN